MLLLFLASLAHTTADVADVLFVNGSFYTGVAAAPSTDAVAVKGGRIIALGTAARQAKGAKTSMVDLRGATVLPGLTDSHFHMGGVGQREMTFNLEGVASLDEFLRRLKAEVAKAKPGEWITGRGWIETFWKPPVFPTRRDLDRVSPDNPVYLVRADGHAGIANSAALRAAGIGKDTPNPFGGEIARDKLSGEATGMLLDKAQALVTSKVVAKPIDLDEALARGGQFALEHGLCQVQIAGSSWAEAERIRDLFKQKRLKVRVYDAIYGPGPDADRLIRQGPILGEFDHRFTVRDIKVVFDGAMGSLGAAMLEPYAGRDTSGFFTAKEDEVRPMLAAALKGGIQVETHAIGDRANRTVLNLYEEAFRGAASYKPESVRWRIEHAQVLHPDDIPRFAKLGVIASMQPSHAIGDLHFAEDRVGLERLKGAYAWHTLIDGGAIVAAGSDAPVERGDPMIEFYAAVARKDLKGFSGAGWHPEQAVSRETALKMFTLWPAYAAFEEKLKGTIEVGKLADLTVLSADIMKIPASEIPKTRCLMTVVGGEIVYRRR